MSAPATNWLDLYRFEDAIEGAAKSILQGAGIPNAYVQRDGDNIATPAVGIQLVAGGATEHYGFRAGDGEQFLDAWTGILTFAVLTDRTRNARAHSDTVAKIRWLMQNISLWEPLMPFHQMTRIIEAGTSPQVRGENNLDASEISFNTVFSIRAGSWPATND